ncbi:hypothetical protein KP509_10G008000 [Ceratopteris richardii]|uniref:Uncharacterized protein n=1 Tax=Ceratopteris richardii TaxID=49495 RepID=A0A8T2TUR0_CERRI|nr:hypothetical protein KP509_10G008000 [Ceratopteris richardii]
MDPAFLGVFLPVVLGFALCANWGKKERAVTVEVGGELGITKRNHKFQKLVEKAWEGANTLFDLFEQACKMHPKQNFLGTRKLIKKELGPSNDGRTFEKLTLGSYVWISYEEAYEQVCRFASGIVALGHQTRGEVRYLL